VSKEYVENRDGGYFIHGTRISLDSIVFEYRKGSAPEIIAREFELLTLEQVYGAIAFYLGHKNEIDRCLEKSAREVENVAPPLSQSNPKLFEKLRLAEQELASKGS
jgi:uncharacterized protein (DUF433 family)